MKKSTILALFAISAAAVAQQSGDKKTMVYTDTDAAYVFQAISKQTGENILYSSKSKITVTINLPFQTVDEAIKAVCSAAGLVYRHVSGLYIVAPASNMKDALAPYSTTSSYLVEGGLAEKLVGKLQDQFPYATIRAIGERIAVTGIKEDLLDAEEMIRDQARIQKSERTTNELVVMQKVTAEEVAPLIKTLFPGLEVTPTLISNKLPQSTRAADEISHVTQQLFGAIALRGPEQLVKAAKAALEKLDSPVYTEGPNKILVKTYLLQFSNGPSITSLLRKTFPDMDVFVGPEEFPPNRAQFNPLGTSIGTSQQQSAVGSQSSSSGGGSTSSSGSAGSGGGGAGATGSSGSPMGTGTHAAAVGDRSKAIILRGHQQDIDAALKLLAEVDVEPQQVVIEVKIIETSPSNSSQLGVSYTFSPVNFYDIAPGSSISAAQGAIGLTSGNTGSILPGAFSRTPLNFAATLNAMVSNQTAKLLATPSLQVIDNDQGSIFIGSTIAVELSSVGSLGGTSQSIVQFPVGIIMLVSPRIMPNGDVLMHVDPVVSTVSSINADGIPQTSAREAETTMIVHDGETVVLGGLIQDQDSVTVSQVPWLSSLPIIGELFKNRTKSHSRTDVLVSITPHIVKKTTTPGTK
jgi:general secretion pathway protein D